MSNFSSGCSTSGTVLADDQAWAATLSAMYPNLALALLGCSGDASGAGKMPPMTLGISKKDGHLRFALYSPDAPRTYFGPQIAANAILEDVEQALEQNLGEWGPPKRNGDGRRH